MISEEFLKSFIGEPVAEHVWQGRALKISLNGPCGALDIWSVYFPTGDWSVEADFHGLTAGGREDCRTFVDLRNRMRNKMRARFTSADLAAPLVLGL